MIPQAKGGYIVCPRGNFTEVSGIEHFTAPQRGHPGFTLTTAVRNTKSTQAGFTGIASVDGTESIIAFWPLDHLVVSFSG